MTVVVGVDGSPGSHPAIRLALQEARYRGTPLLAVMAYGPETALGAPAARPVSPLAAPAEQREMTEATWQDRVDALGRGHYRRYDERTATMLGEGAELAGRRWNGDLRRLHREAGGDSGTIRSLLTEFPGIGPSGADIFVREVQGVWPDVAPFFDSRVLSGAKKVGLPGDARALADLAGRGQAGTTDAAEPCGREVGHIDVEHARVWLVQQEGDHLPGHRGGGRPFEPAVIVPGVQRERRGGHAVSRGGQGGTDRARVHDPQAEVRPVVDPGQQEPRPEAERPAGRHEGDEGGRGLGRVRPDR